MKKKILGLVFCLILFSVCGCNNMGLYDITTYRCGSVEDDEYVEFTYLENKEEYIKLKYYYQVFDIDDEEIEAGLDEYKQMVTTIKNKIDLNINWKLKNNKLVESTEVELTKVDDEFLMKLESFGDKYEFTESVEGIYYGLKDYFYVDGRISNNVISDFILENNCEVVK